MYMVGIGTSTESDIVRELQGARILITGLTASTGVDIARGFARLGSRLVIHASELSPEITEVVAVVSQSAREIKLYTDSIREADAAVCFAQRAAQAFGGLDAVINLSSISKSEIEGVASEAEVERLVSAKLTPLAHLTAVTANRMALVLSEGHILNVVEMDLPQSARTAAVAAFARTALASMTKAEAHRWAQKGIRINAVGPDAVSAPKVQSGMHMTNEPDIAALAIYLTSRKGAALSGHMFDTESVA